MAKWHIERKSMKILKVLKLCMWVSMRVCASVYVCMWLSIDDIGQDEKKRYVVFQLITGCSIDWIKFRWRSCYAQRFIYIFNVGFEKHLSHAMQSTHSQTLLWISRIHLTVIQVRIQIPIQTHRLKRSIEYNMERKKEGVSERDEERLKYNRNEMKCYQIIEYRRSPHHNR